MRKSDLLAELTDVVSDSVSQYLWLLSVGIDNNPWGQYQPLIPSRKIKLYKTWFFLQRSLHFHWRIYVLVLYNRVQIKLKSEMSGIHEIYVLLLSNSHIYLSIFNDRAIVMDSSFRHKTGGNSICNSGVWFGLCIIVCVCLRSGARAPECGSLSIGECEHSLLLLYCQTYQFKNVWNESQYYHYCKDNETKWRSSGIVDNVYIGNL